MAVSIQPPRVQTESNFVNPALKQASLDKLYRHQTKEYEITKQRLKQWTKFKNDYLALKTQLSVINDRVTHQVMVPFGPRAFFPGRVKHTNDILVLLGDNWFVQRSAKQASEIVDRRLKQCDEMLVGLNKELKLTDSWREHTKMLFTESGDAKQGVEIVESEEEEGWREKHQEKVRQYKKKLSELQEKEKKGPIQSEEDLWARLDELELLEELQQELEMLGEEEEESEEDEDENENEDEDENEKDQSEALVEKEETTESHFDASDTLESASVSDRKKVTWSESDSVRQFCNDEILSKSSTQENSPDVLRITFKHSKETKKRARFTQSIEDEDEDSDKNLIVSTPSDIFHKFYGAKSDDSEPKSILKVKKSTTPNRTVPDVDVDVKTKPHKPDFVEPVPVAVGDEVVERVPCPENPEALDEQVNTHRPVSRFKAARMNRRL